MPTNQAERAFRAWPELTQCAKEKKTITYGDLAKKLGLHPRVIRFVLGPIQDYCLSEHLPPLTILVVSQSNGVPSDGFIAWDAEDLQTGFDKVYDFNWKIVGNPFVYAESGATDDEIVDQLISGPENAAEIWARVRVRGTAQMLFRKTLLRAYDGRCAFCGLTFEDALEAAHIVPWSNASPAQRLSPSNGILLCSTHHKLFDAGMMTLSKSGDVLYYDPEGKYSGYDKTMTLDLHKNTAFLPQDQKLRPSVAALDFYYSQWKWTTKFLVTA